MAKAKAQESPEALTPELECVGFEDAIGSLEQVIEQLERDDLTLEKALEYFEQGIRLMRRCDSHLKSANGRLRELLKGENGEFVEKILGTTLDSFVDKGDIDG